MSVASGRLSVIDTLRGVTILEMIIAHAAGYLPGAAQKAIVYTETAMALFVILAGLIVGWRAIEFSQAPTAQSRQLISRAARVLGVQYVLVLTAGLAVFSAGLAGVVGNQTWQQFLLDSLLLRNQIGLLHILPTFFPLFLVAPAVLWAVTNHKIMPLVSVSAGLFLIGHFNPHFLNYGTPAIFPFLMFQLYFVAGCIAGNHARHHGLPSPAQAKCWFAPILAAMCVTMAATHLKFVPAGTIQTHPLNLWGLLYHVPLIATVITGVLALEPHLAKMRGAALLQRFGRHSMLAFVLHVYLAIALRIINHWHPLPVALIVLSIMLSIVIMDAVFKRYETARRARQPSLVIRNAGLLFG